MQRRSFLKAVGALAAGAALGVGKAASPPAGVVSAGTGAPGTGYLCVNVRDFGAVGDGVTDDTEAICRACDAIQSAGKGTLYLGPGSFRVCGLIFAEDVSIRGAGPGKTTIL